MVVGVGMRWVSEQGGKRGIPHFAFGIAVCAPRVPCSLTLRTNPASATNMQITK